MKTFLMAGLALALFAAAGCTGPGGTKADTVHERIESACVSAGAAYGIIAKANAIKPLPAATQAKVIAAVDITDGPCKLEPGEDYPYTMAEAALRELEGAAATLNTIKGMLP